MSPGNETQHYPRLKPELEVKDFYPNFANGLLQLALEPDSLSQYITTNDTTGTPELDRYSEHWNKTLGFSKHYVAFPRAVPGELPSSSREQVGQLFALIDNHKASHRLFAPEKFWPECSFLAGLLRILADSGQSGRKKIDRLHFLVPSLLAASCKAYSLCFSSRIIESVVDFKCYRSRTVLQTYGASSRAVRS